MRKTIIFMTAVALSATTLSFADAAFAHPSGRGDREAVTRAEVESRTNDAFAKLDVNADGVLSADDRKAGVAKIFAEADTDGNGQLSVEEFTAAHESRREDRADRRGQRQERFGGGMGGRGDRMGGNRGPGGPGGPGMMRGPGMAGGLADADNDGKITQAEFSSAALSRFDKADADGDGTISADEHRAMRGSHRGKRGRSAG